MFPYIWSSFGERLKNYPALFITFYSRVKYLFLVGLLLCQLVSGAQTIPPDEEWSQMKKTGRGELIVYWYENPPIFYKGKNNELLGIEYEIVEGFVKFLKDSFDVQLKVNFLQQKDFNHTYQAIAKKTSGFNLGAARISITEERKKQVNFSSSYMADISVLLASNDLPFANNNTELRKILSYATAVTMEGTTFEKDLIALKNENQLGFPVTYVTKNSGIMEAINRQNRSFGYVSLLTYLYSFNSAANHLKRQNFLMKIHSGYALIFPKRSSLEFPFTLYTTSKHYESSLNKIIANYVNLDLYQFIQQLQFNPENNISLLNKEKSIQENYIKIQGEQIQNERNDQQNLIYFILSVGILTILASILYRVQKKNHYLIKEQKMWIESQSDEIKSIKDNLELSIQARMEELENENKTLEDSAFFTAHKLRAPLASILGLVYLLQKTERSQEERLALERLNETLQNLDKILHHAIRIIETADVPDKQP